MSRKRGQQTDNHTQQRQAKSQRTADDDDNVNGDDKHSPINKLSTIFDDIIQHKLWPLMTDVDANRLMQADRALYVYYETHVYAMKRFFMFNSENEMQRHFPHLITGPLRIIHLSIYNMSLLTCKPILRARPALIRLAVNYNRGDMIAIRLLAAFIAETPTLQTLSFELIDAFVTDLAAPLCAHKNITALDVIVTSFTPETVRILAEVVRHNKSITNLHVHCNFGEDGGTVFAQAFAYNTTINTLTLYETELGIAFAIALRDAIIHPNSAITALDMCYDSEEDCADESAVAMSEIMHKLTTFSFNYCLSMSAINAICNALMKPNARLQHLNIPYLHSKAMSLVCTMINANTSLRSLRLYQGEYEDKDFIAFGEALKRNTTLTSLTFNAQGQTPDAVILHITSALLVNSTLLHFAHNNTNVDCINMALAKNRHIQELHKQYNIKQRNKDVGDLSHSGSV